MGGWIRRSLAVVYSPIFDLKQSAFQHEITAFLMNHWLELQESNSFQQLAVHIQTKS